MIRVVFEGARELSRALEHLPVKASVASREATMFTAAALVKQAQINSTGPPRLARKGTQGANPGTGPGVVSGRHRRGIRVLSHGPMPALGYAASVGPTMVYSRRLELGFTGTDSAGRHYNQPPYPYLRPAYEFIVRYVALPAYKRAWAAAVK